MSDLRDVVVESPSGGQRFVEAVHGEIEEHRGRIRLLRDVRVLRKPVLQEEYALRSKDPVREMRARYVGPDPTHPGALAFDMIPRGRRRP